MKKFFLILSILLVLAACAPTPTQTSEVWQTSEVLPTITPTPTKTKTPRPTATATPIALGVEQLDSMTNEQKLSVAPQPITAPDNIVSSFLPNQTAKDITWGAKSLAFWDRVVAYQGTTKTGESIALYYDLESGQWAKKYDSIDKIPTDKIPDVMIITDATGDHLIRNKLQYEKEKDWISQPQVLVGDKMVYRDEKGYPKAVWDTTNHKWLTPEQADVVMTLEKWREAIKGPYVGDNGKDYDLSIMFDPNFRDILTNPNQITNLPQDTQMIVLNPSGEITVFSTPQEAADKAKEGAIILVPKDQNVTGETRLLLDAAFRQYQKGNKNIYVRYGKYNVDSIFGPQIQIQIDQIPQSTDSKGNIVSPVFRRPDFFTVWDSNLHDWRRPEDIGVNDLFNWLDQIVKGGFNDSITIYSSQASLDFTYPPK